MPIAPMIFINVAIGIGTGIGTNTLCFHPTDIIRVLKRKERGGEALPMHVCRCGGGAVSMGAHELVARTGGGLPLRRRCTCCMQQTDIGMRRGMRGVRRVMHVYGRVQLSHACMCGRALALYTWAPPLALARLTCCDCSDAIGRHAMPCHASVPCECRRPYPCPSWQAHLLRLQRGQLLH